MAVGAGARERAVSGCEASANLLQRVTAPTGDLFVRTVEKEVAVAVVMESEDGPRDHTMTAATAFIARAVGKLPAMGIGMAGLTVLCLPLEYEGAGRVL